MATVARVASQAMGVAVGNKVTVTGITISWSDSTPTAGSLSAKQMGMRVIGDIHGFLRFPFADPETLEGALTPNDLATAQIKLTQGGSGGVLALLCEEVFGY